MEEDDGGQNVHARAASAAAAKKKQKKKRERKKKKDGNTSREQEPRHPVTLQPRHSATFAQIPGITDALRERLAALGATEPSFMIGKYMKMSDVDREQARLLFSCKRESLPQVTSVFTETEAGFVDDKVDGLLVPALDRGGRSYDVVCKYLTSNSGYRFITGWKSYVLDNDVGETMRVEIWRFRSRQLPNRYEMRQGKKGKAEKVPVMVDSGHPDGSLGLVLLDYENDLLEPEQAADGEADVAPPVQETATGHMESNTTTTTTAEDKLADGDGECAEPMIIRERNSEFSRADVFSAAMGLLELRRHNSGGGGVVEEKEEDDDQ